MDTLRIHLFGRLSIQWDGSRVFESLPPKAQELFVYLLLYRERWHTRERLAAELWPEANPSDARSRLRRLMWRLQTGLSEDTAARLLAVEGDWLSINSEVSLWLDVAVVEETYRRLGMMTGGGLSPAQVAELEGVTELIQGDLLDNWYQEWCVVERERLRIIQISILSHLVSHYVAVGEIERGVAAASRLLQIDRAHEGAHRQLMRLRYMAGDRTGALRQFAICTQVLDEEFSVAPERPTLALYDEIRRELPGVDTHLPAMRPPEIIANRVSIETIHSRLDQLQKVIIESQARVSRELYTLHTAIRSHPAEDHRHEHDNS